ncbi:toprim domain-containing protein [Legionella pneumophila]
MDLHALINEFKKHMENMGLSCTNCIIPDGKIHRFHVAGDKIHSNNGWYFLSTLFKRGVFGSWRTGEKYAWCCKHLHSLSPEYSRYKQHLNNLLINQQAVQRKAAIRAKKLWDGSLPALHTHPYLITKKIYIPTARQIKSTLALSVVDLDYNICSLQFINKEGEKKFLKGGAIYSNFIPIQGNHFETETILICEGAATGATLAKAYPNSCIVAACSSGNLKPLALKIRALNHETKIIICADDDRLTPHNPGLKLATEAAVACNGFLIRPNWPNDAPTNLSDFNDLHCWLIDQGRLV